MDDDDSVSTPITEPTDDSSNAAPPALTVSPQAEPGYEGEGNAPFTAPAGEAPDAAAPQPDTWQGGQEGEDWSSPQDDPPAPATATTSPDQTAPSTARGQTSGKVRLEDVAQNGIGFYTALNDPPSSPNGGAITPNPAPATGGNNSPAGSGVSDSGPGPGGTLFGSYDPSTAMGYDLTKPIGFPGTGLDGLPAPDPSTTPGTGSGLPFENPASPWQFSFDGPPPTIPVDDPNAATPDLPEYHVTLDPQEEVSRGTQPGTLPPPEIPGVTGDTPLPDLSNQPPGGPFAGPPGDLLQSYDPSKAMGYDLKKPIGFPGTGLDGLPPDPALSLQQPKPQTQEQTLDNPLPFNLGGPNSTKPLDGGFPQFHPVSPDKIRTYSTNGVSVQVEGSPFAYDPRDPWAQHGALDYLQNAGHPGNWYGVHTNKAGQPNVNEFGNYVSQTGWQRPGTDGTHQSDYVNGDYIPTVSLSTTQAQGMKYGDAVWLVNETTGQATYAVYADGRGDRDGIEISTAAATNLGVLFGRDGPLRKNGQPPGPTDVWSQDHIVMYTLPGSRVPGWFPAK
jgi:hypothetical protein